ncbi:MAG: PDZ domain-containing protein [Chitinophagaceae bacterium]
MKKIILLALCWPICTYSVWGQKEKTKDEKREIIIIKNGDKEKKLTIETKDGETFINGKPSSEYKDGDIEVIKQNFHSDMNFDYAPRLKNIQLYNSNYNGEKKPFLGVTTEKADDGVNITDVSKGSAADNAGLKEGDIITKVGNKNINTPDELMDVVNKQKPRDNITVSYKRNGRSADTKAMLGDRSISKSITIRNNGKGNGNFNFTMPHMPALPHQPFAMSWGFGRGRLGVRIEDTENDSGAKITEVHDETAAAKAGLKENDLITEINGKKVINVNEVRKELAEVKDKTSYNIKAKRNGSDMNFEIKIPKKINKADL